MLNFDSAFLYEKVLPVLSKAPSPVKTKSVASVHFMAESGDAVAGLTTKIAFKATDQWGGPIEITGSLQDNTGYVIQTFRSIHNGMGYFLFTPKLGTTYVAKWRDAGGENHTTALASFKPSGALFRVALAGNKRTVTVERSAASAPQQFYLVGTMFQNRVFSTRSDLRTKLSDTKVIPTVVLPTGILTITLFDSAHNALAERITFVQNNAYSFQPVLSVLRYGHNKRAKNDWEIRLPDSLSTHLPIAVTDAALNTDSSNNIYSHLLLTSDLKGSVHQPAAYFINPKDSTPEHLDLVMLTNGWRRFNWDALNQSKPLALNQGKDSAYLSLSGRLYGIQPGRISGETLVAILKTKDSAASQMVVLPIGSNGQFNQPDFLFFDTLQVYYQFKKGSFLNNASVRFMENRLGPITLPVRFIKPQGKLSSDTTGVAYHRLLAAEKLDLRNFQSAKMLSNVTVRTQARSRINELDKRYTSGLFSGADSYQFDLTEDGTAAGSLSIFQYLQGRVAGLQINNSGGSTSLQWRGGSPSVYLDEILTDINAVASEPVSNIAYVKVFRPPFMGGFNGAGGAVAIYTKKGGDTKSTSKGLNNTTITGYTPIKEFYSPNYGTFDARHEQRDLRTTLYWNPFITTSPTRSSVKLSFYNNDVTQAFRVIIEGITKDGQLTHFETIVE